MLSFFPPIWANGLHVGVQSDLVDNGRASVVVGRTEIAMPHLVLEQMLSQSNDDDDNIALKLTNQQMRQNEAR